MQGDMPKELPRTLLGETGGCANFAPPDKRASPQESSTHNAHEWRWQLQINHFFQVKGVHVFTDVHRERHPGRHPERHNFIPGRQTAPDP